MRIGTLVLLVAFLAAPALGATTAAQSRPTLDNLQAAYNGESNARARYLEFAKKADAEGFQGVGSLFRAAARAEEIHAANHAAVIRTLGGAPNADIKPAAVKSTKENLQAAIDGESYERDTMYPEFIAKAREERNTDAVRTFNLAKTAEAEHAKLYREALENLDARRGAQRALYVCTVCGFTAMAMPGEKCPSCFSKLEKFEKVP